MNHAWIGRETCPVGVKRVIRDFSYRKLKVGLPGKLPLFGPLAIRCNLLGRRGPRSPLVQLVEELAGPAKLVQVVGIRLPVEADAGPVELLRTETADTIVIGQLTVKERFIETFDRQRVMELQTLRVDPMDLPTEAGHFRRDIAFDEKPGYPNILVVVLHSFHLAARWKPDSIFLASQIEIASSPLLFVRIPIAAGFEILAPDDAKPGAAIDFLAHNSIQLALKPAGV
jgi:hypothetical protein